MKDWIQRNFTFVEWGVGLGVSLLSILAWAIATNSKYNLSTLDIFPVLGLVAFGLMWSHYMLGAIRRWSAYERKKNDSYWVISAGLVLCLIILHPVLLNAALIEGGLGLPIGSYFAAYGPTDGWFVVLGTSALIVFLLFELRRWFGKKQWWKWIEYAQIIAMVAIFIHGTKLGTNTTSGWYEIVWWGLALTLIFAWVYNWKYDKAHMPRRGDGGAKE